MKERAVKFADALRALHDAGKIGHPRAGSGDVIQHSQVLP